MKILHVGNPQAFKNFAICDFFRKRGDEIHYFSPVPPEQEREGITYHYDHAGKRTKSGFVRNVIGLRKLTRTIKPSLVHAHNVHGYGWMAALAGCSPLVVHAYGGDVLPEQTQGMKRRQRWLSRYTLKKADRLIVTGRHMVTAVANDFGLQPGKVNVVSRGVDLDVFRPLSEEEKLSHRVECGIDAGRFVLLSPRYLLNSVYNIDTVLRAVAMLRDRFPEILLLQLHNHAVSEPCFMETSRLIRELQLTEMVLMLRQVPNEEMPRLYGLSDVCISVPSSDGFPVTVLEASACKVPLIASRLPYSSEWFTHDENGFLVEQRDAEGLACAISELRLHRDKRVLLAENSFKKVVAEAESNRCLGKLAAIYEEVGRG